MEAAPKRYRVAGLNQKMCLRKIHRMPLCRFNDCLYAIESRAKRRVQRLGPSLCGKTHFLISWRSRRRAKVNSDTNASHVRGNAINVVDKKQSFHIDKKHQS